mmetsp:Transcript_16140/g.36914  ORF Transcript_16140/g.36914 Transcript_16140/m.36914 type:complete len:131 (-) Transcript_16140:266-658(-)
MLVDHHLEEEISLLSLRSAPVKAEKFYVDQEASAHLACYRGNMAWSRDVGAADSNLQILAIHFPTTIIELMAISREIAYASFPNVFAHGSLKQMREREILADEVNRYANNITNVAGNKNHRLSPSKKFCL